MAPSKKNYNFEFSVIMAVYNTEDYLEEAIDSIIEQDFGFKKVQLIIVDDGSTDNSKEIALNYQSKYPDNILVLSKENGGAASARNLGLEYIQGKYLFFADSDDKISQSTFSSVYNLFENNDEIDIVGIPIMFFERQEGDHPLNFKFKKESQIIDILEKPQYIQMSGPSTFFRSDAIKDVKYDLKIINGVDSLFINKIMLFNKKYGLVGLEDDAIHYYRRRYAQTSILDLASNKEGFYTDKLKYYYKHLIDYCIEREGEVLEYIQHVIIYSLQHLITKPDFPDSFDKDKIKEFWDYLSYILNHIDENVIINHESVGLLAKFFFISFKNKDFHIVTNSKKHQVFLKSKDFIINRLHNHKINIDFVELKNDFLNISGNIISSCNNDSIYVIAEKKDEEGNIESFKSSYFDYPTRSTQRLLSIDWKFTHNFDLKVPVSNNEVYSIKLKVIYEEDNNKVVMNNRITFRNYSNISEMANYFVKNSQIIIFENNTFYSVPYSYTKLAKLSAKSIKRNINEEKGFYRSIYTLIYLILYPFFKSKKIWIFIDRKDRADDNAEHLFKYSINQKDEIKKYFIVEKNSPDFKHLSKLGNVISFSSFKYKILYLFAEKIISSQATNFYFNPFFGKLTKFYTSLKSSEVYFLRHGVSKDDMSRWLTKYNKNLSLINSSSDMERNAILNGNYNYDESIIETLGLPRFDNLNNDNILKQIVIMPSWRKDLKNDNDVLNSEYFLKWNNLINNKNLISIAKNKGYSILFKPHPNLYEFIDLFDENNYVKIDFDKKYQEIFNEASLLITDYSSVFFDFAYLKKPIIYYQYSDDYHFNLDEGYFKYDSMGFGEVIKEEDNLVNKIKEYLDNDCEMEEEYKERVNRFFKYTDKNNCKRCYEWILKH